MKVISKDTDFQPIARFISEAIQDMAKVTIVDELGTHMPSIEFCHCQLLP